MYTPTYLEPWNRPQCYIGAQWNGYYRAPVGRARDSHCLTESNWGQQWQALEPLKADCLDSDGDEISSPCVVSENHWAVGWIEWVAIHESNEAALREADRLAERLENYPVLDEEDFSEREREEADKVWKDCYRPKERIAYIRKASLGEFEFHGFADLLAVVRGKYFNGYASGLLS